MAICKYISKLKLLKLQIIFMLKQSAFLYNLILRNSVKEKTAFFFCHGLSLTFIRTFCRLWS